MAANNKKRKAEDNECDVLDCGHNGRWSKSYCLNCNRDCHGIWTIVDDETNDAWTVQGETTDETQMPKPDDHKPAATHADQSQDTVILVSSDDEDEEPDVRRRHTEDRKCWWLLNDNVCVEETDGHQRVVIELWPEVPDAVSDDVLDKYLEWLNVIDRKDGRPKTMWQRKQRWQMYVDGCVGDDENVLKERREMINSCTTMRKKEYVSVDMCTGDLTYEARSVKDDYKLIK